MLTLAEPRSSGSGQQHKQNGVVLDTLYSDIPQLKQMIDLLLEDIQQGKHLLLIENLGLQNKNIANRLLQILNRPTEYLLLHRDTTIESLIEQPNHETGMYEDSPLIKAVKYGCVLVVDDADKAPTNVTCSLNTLMQKGEMVLSDGRIIMSKKIGNSYGGKFASFIPLHENFRMIVMASHNGFPFLEKESSAPLARVFKGGQIGTTVKAVGSSPVVTTAVFGGYGTGPHTATAVATGSAVATATALTYGRGSSTATATASGSSVATAIAHSYDAGVVTATVTTCGSSVSWGTADAYNAGRATATVTSTGSSVAGAIARAQDLGVATATASTTGSASVKARAIARGNQVVTDTQVRP